jgi:hypothetical protein
MTKTLTVLAAAATLALAAVAAPQPAQARDGQIAAGIIGGLAVGAILGAAVAGSQDYGHDRQYRHDRPEPHYYRPAPAYYRAAPAYYGPDCYWTQQRVWNGYRWQLRSAQVCD